MASPKFHVDLMCKTPGCRCAGNSGSRRDAEEILYHMLPKGVTVFAFDFAVGCCAGCLARRVLCKASISCCCWLFHLDI